MTEKYPESETKLTVTEEEAIRDPAQRTQYSNERIALIKSGVPTWMLRGFDAPQEMEAGFVVDYYADGRPMGFIDGNDLDGYHVYGPQIEEDAGPHHVNTETIELRSQAQKMLQDYIAETLLN